MTLVPAYSQTTTATASLVFSSEAIGRRQRSGRAVEAIGGVPTMTEAATD